MKSLSEGGVGFRPDLLRPLGQYRGFAAPSPRPSPRRGEGDDVSLAPSFQERPGRFSPSPRRGEGARRAGEGRAQERKRTEAESSSLGPAFVIWCAAKSLLSRSTDDGRRRTNDGLLSNFHLACAKRRRIRDGLRPGPSVPQQWTAPPGQ